MCLLAQVRDLFRVLGIFTVVELGLFVFCKAKYLGEEI